VSTGPEVAKPDALLTLPEASVRTGIGLDRIRKSVKQKPEVAALLVRHGPLRLIRISDLGRFRALIAGEAQPEPEQSAPAAKSPSVETIAHNEAKVRLAKDLLERAGVSEESIAYVERSESFGPALMVAADIITGIPLHEKKWFQDYNLFWVGPQIVPAPKPVEKGRMTVAQANTAAMELATRLGEAFFHYSERRQAIEIGCSWQTWARTTFYKTATAKRIGPKSRR
jgi:hypothetical protein